MDMQPADAVYAICSVADIPNRRAKGFHLVRRDDDGSDKPWHIVIIRWDRKLYGYVNVCPHQGVNLDWEPNQFLDGSGTHLICGKHGSLFEIATGHCVDGPCAGQNLQTVRLAVVDGDICVTGIVLAEDEDPAS